jgi:hypothetical protein
LGGVLYGDSLNRVRSRVPVARSGVPDVPEHVLMSRKALTYLLLLLVLSASPANAWAAVAVASAAGVVPAEDDEPIPAVRQQQAKRSRAGDAPLPGERRLEVAGGLATARASARPAEGTPPGPAGSRLLYLLMSLQR